MIAAIDHDSGSENGEDGFQDWEEDIDECTEVKSLFCENVLPTVSALMVHDIENFGFDLFLCCQAVGMEDIALIKLVNFIRMKVSESGNEGKTRADQAAFAAALQEQICQHPEIASDDQYMVPVWQNGDTPDPLLYLLSEAISNPLDEDNGTTGDSTQEPPSCPASAQILELQEELEKYKALVSTLVVSEDAEGSKESSEIKASSEPNDGYYFDSYGQLSIHETMLRDRPRTSTYGASMTDNPDFFKDKTVLDVGCGTGILCLFAAKAGAKKVIGVDLSSIIGRTEKVIRKNGYSDVITLVRGRLEEVTLPVAPGEVDVIVSEWMGYGLYFENMLTSVLYARDRYLNRDCGVVMPNQASLFLEAFCAQGEDDRVGFWSDVYGFDMEEMRDMLVSEAQVQYVLSDAIVSNRQEIHKLDISTALEEQLDFDVPFSLIMAENTTLHGFVISFDVLFGRGNLANTVDSTAAFKESTLSTGPAAPATHWKQTVLWLEVDKRVKLEKGTVVSGSLTYVRSTDNQRDYDIILRWTDPHSNEEHFAKYILAS